MTITLVKERVKTRTRDTVAVSSDLFSGGNEMRLLLGGLCLSTCLAMTTVMVEPVIADALLIEAPEANDIVKPVHGESMDQVREKYGDPQQIMPAVGDPPITRWVYPEYTVYFEYNLVIYSVSD